LDGTGADITVVAAFKSGDVGLPECTIDGEEVSCGEPTESGTKTTTYSISVSNLPSGEHEFVITLTLVRKGTTVSGSTTFETVGEPISFETACVDYGGTFGPNGPLANVCLKEYASHEDAEADFDNFFAALDPTCRGDADLGGGLGTGSTIDFNCATEGHLQLLAMCPEEASSNSGVDVVSCQTSDASIREPFRALCLEIGGYYLDEVQADPDAYVCLAALDDPETACTDAGGTYDEPNALGWTCSKTYASGDDLDSDLEELTSSLNVACDQRVAYGITRPTETSLSYGCGNDTVTQLDSMCDAPGRVASGASRDEFFCQTSDDIAAPFETICVAAGADYRVDETTPPTYLCEDPVSTG